MKCPATSLHYNRFYILHTLSFYGMSFIHSKITLLLRVGQSSDRFFRSFFSGASKARTRNRRSQKYTFVNNEEQKDAMH